MCVGGKQQARTTKMSTAAATAPASARKTSRDAQPSAALLRDIREAAAFLALMEVYKLKTTNKKELHKEMEKHFFGDESSGTISTLKMLLDGSSAFEYLYEDHTTDGGADRMLKKHIHGTNNWYVCGEHFDDDILSRQAFTRPGGAKVSGRTLYDAAKKVHANNKKAIAMMKRLRGKVVNTNRRGEVIGYASGLNAVDMLRYLNDGMYVSLKKNEEEIDLTITPPAVSDSATSPGNTSNTAEGSSEGSADSTDAIVTDAAANEAADDPTEGGLFTEEDMELMATFDGNGEAGEVADMPAPDDDWLPFGDVAPDTYRFPGYTTLCCFGPHTQFLSMLLTTAGNTDAMKKSKKGGRAHQRNEEAKRARLERHNNPDRGMNIKTKVQIASVAQNEDGANMRDRETRIASINAIIQSKQTLAERKLKYADLTSNEERKDNLVAEAMKIDEEIAGLNKQLEELSNEKRGKNLIVEKVIEQAATLMGIGDDSATNQVATAARVGEDTVAEAEA